MSHTPGPWGVIANENLPESMQVIHVTDVEANARIIAAAPDLLAACKQVKRWAEEEEVVIHSSLLSIVEDAIAKATNGGKQP